MCTCKLACGLAGEEKTLRDSTPHSAVCTLVAPIVYHRRAAISVGTVVLLSRGKSAPATGATGLKWYFSAAGSSLFSTAF